MKIDPTYLPQLRYMLSKISCPLAIPILDDQDQPLGLAMYTERKQGVVYYTIGGKKFALKLNPI